jgi:hypothetical protein
MAALLSRWLVVEGHYRSILGDGLGKLATIIGRPPYENGVVSDLAEVFARLHARVNTNVVQPRIARPRR